MKEIREHPICVVVVGAIMFGLCLALIHPAKVAFIVAGTMLLFYLILLAIPLGNCLEMGVFAIVMTVVVTQVFGAFEAWKARKDKKNREKVEQSAAPLPRDPRPGHSDGER